MNRFESVMKILTWIRTKGDKLISLGIIFVVFLLVVMPLSILILSSFYSGRPGLPGGTYSLINYINAYTDISTYTTIGRSIYFAVVVTCISLFIGGIFAWLIERTNMPGRGLAYSVMLSPLAIPRMLFAIAWVLLLSGRIGLINKFLQHIFGFKGFEIYSMGGMILTQSFIQIPTAFLMVLGALRSMDPSLEEAAYVSRSNNFSTLRKITIPIMRPPLLAAAIFLFIVNIEVFEIPGIIGIPAGIWLFSTAIYSSATIVAPPDYGLANTYAVVFLVLSASLIVIYRKATKRSERYQTVTGKGFRPRQIDLGRGKYLALTAFIFFFIITILLPVLVLLYSSFLPLYVVPSAEIIHRLTLSNYYKLFNAPWLYKVMKNTFLLMIVAPSCCVFLAALISWVVHRTRVSMNWKRIVDILSFLPQSFPSIVIALSLLIVFLKFRSISILGTVWVICLVFVIRYLPYASRTVGAAVIQIHKELEESAQVCRASEFKSFLKITLPLIAPAFVNAWIWVAMNSARALSAALMLYSSKNEVLSTRIWELWYEGDITLVSALAIMMISILLLISIIGRMVAKRLSRR